MATEQQEFEFATLEYHQLCQNVRESWAYITTLIRQYLLIQVLLLGLVGLGNSAIRDYTAEQCTTAAQKDAQEREAKIRTWQRRGAIITFMLLGAGLSFGAFWQSQRLFINSTNFVTRAAAIEEKFGIGELKKEVKREDGRRLLPLHEYMLSRLNDRNLNRMETALSITYGLGVAVWIIMMGLFIVPFIA